VKLEGLHHITMITGDARANVAFYAGVLGLRLVKKTVNFDQPEAYHLYFGDEQGSPGSILTWFEFAGAAPGRAGAGMIHRIDLGVGSEAALDFWESRLTEHGVAGERVADAALPSLAFSDAEGLAFRLVVAGDGNPPLRAEHPDVPPEHAILGIEGARAYAPDDPAEPAPLLTDTLGFTLEGGGDHRLQGEERHVHWGYDPAPSQRGIQGAGSVHHIAWASRDEDHLGWQARVREAGLAVTDVRDRDYFRAIYFNEPRGILFEIATLSPGFAADEAPEHLGEELRVPRMHAHLRDRLESLLTPVDNPRTVRR
jgi:glyoxalase family protein